jgi:hypothetical protein
MPGQHAFQRRLESIEELIQRIGSTADPSVKKSVDQLLQLVMELHGTAVERLLEIVDAAGAPGAEIIDSLGRDPLVSSLLVLHGLHPLDLETRVRQAVEKTRGGEVEVLSIVDGAVRLRLHPSGSGAAAQSFRTTVEAAVYNAAPDVTSLAMEGGEREGFVPLQTLLGAVPAAVNGKGGL